MKVDIKVKNKISFQPTIYPRKILERFQMAYCKLASIPIDPWVANSLLFYDNQAN